MQRAWRRSASSTSGSPTTVTLAAVGTGGLARLLELPRLRVALARHPAEVLPVEREVRRVRLAGPDLDRLLRRERERLAGAEHLARRPRHLRHLAVDPHLQPRPAVPDLHDERDAL